MIYALINGWDLTVVIRDSGVRYQAGEYEFHTWYINMPTVWVLVLCDLNVSIFGVPLIHACIRVFETCPPNFTTHRGNHRSKRRMKIISDSFIERFRRTEFSSAVGGYVKATSSVAHEVSFHIHWNETKPPIHRKTLSSSLELILLIQRGIQLSLINKHINWSRNKRATLE